MTKKFNSTCVIQRKVSITVLAIGAIRLNLTRFIIKVWTKSFQFWLCYIPCIAVSSKTGFSNISIWEEGKTWGETLMKYKFNRKVLFFIFSFFSSGFVMHMIPVLLHSSWELLTSRCMQWMQIDAIKTKPGEKLKMLNTSLLLHLYFQLGAHCSW